MQRLTRTLAMASALAFMGVLAGCGDDVVVEPDPGISLTPPSASLQVGQSAQFSATVTGLANKTVTWSSSSANATVDQTGKVTAVAAGSASIIAATTDPNVKASAIVTITAVNKGVTKVEISPNTQILKAGDFAQLTANVTRDPGVAGTVTWASSATGIATVDGTGKVTAVANGSAVITAASTVDPTVTGTAAITVRPIQLAQISVKAVTQGNTNTPVNFNNVFGQIDVVLNVDPGEERVTKVDVNFDGVSACTRNLSASESDALRTAAAFAEVEAVDIVCSINTAEFNSTTGAVKFTNGAHVLSASGTIAGPPARTITATDQSITLQNQSGFIATVTNANTVGGAASAINPITGLKWVQGDVTLKLTAVNYAAGGATVSQLSGAFLGRAFTSNTPTGQVFTITFLNSGTAGTNVVGYQTPVASGQSLPLVTGSTLSTGSTGPTNVLNIGAAAANAGLTALDSTRLDNVAPVAPTVGAMPIWLNASFNFDSTSTGVTNVTDAGVDNVTTEFYYIAGALPATACSLTGMTKVTSASALTETLVSSAYRGRIVIKDALGNTTCANLAPGAVAGGQFGADFTAPTNPTFAGPANDTSFITTGAADAATFAFTNLQDNASGFGTYPMLATLRRFNAAGTTTCLIGTTATTCATKGDTSASVSVTRNTATEGYYLFSGQVQDSALNVNSTVVNRRVLVDATPSAVTGILSMPSLITGQGTAVFNGVVTDNIDLAQYYGLLTYTGAPVIRTATAALGTYGEDALTKTANVALTLSGAMRCLATSPGGVIGAPAKLATIDLRVQDFAQANDDVSSGIGGGAQVIPPAAVENCAAIANINSWTDSLPAAAVNISKAGTTASTATTVNLMARALVPLNVTANPFQRVEFYRVNAGGELVLIGTGTAALTQTPTERIWTYTFPNWDPPASLANGAVTIHAIGVTSTGDGALTAGQSNITIVP